MNYILLVFLFLIFSIIAYYMVQRFMKKDKERKNQFIENKEFDPYNKYEAELYLFMTSWCPHCKETKPLWEEYKNGYKSKKYEITFIEVDCDEKENMAEMFKIEEYPTIVLVRNNKKYYYDANLSKETLDKFINTIMEL